MTDRPVPTEPTLLPCPFCGDRMIYGDASNFLGEALHTVEHSGESDTSEDCVLWTIKSWPTRQEAAEAWNRRTASPAAPGAEVEPVAYRKRLSDVKGHCTYATAEDYFTYSNVDIEGDWEPLFASPPTTDAIRARRKADGCLTPDEKKAQAKRCPCRGVDDYCPCQNAPDAQTRRERSNA